MKKALAMVLAVMMLLGCISIASAEDAKIKLNVWSFTNELQGMIEKYYAPNHPEIEFEFQIYPTGSRAATKGITGVLRRPSVHYRGGRPGSLRARTGGRTRWRASS